MSQNSKKIANPEEHAALLIEQAIESLSRALDDRGSHDYSPSWLRSGEMGSGAWETSYPGQHKTLRVSFDHMLPDGSNLLDLENEKLLATIQRLAIHLRSGHISVDIGPDRWLATITWTKNLASYLILNNEIYEPKSCGFTLLDENGVKALLEDISIGSWSHALMFQERILEHFHQSIYGTPATFDITENPFELPSKFRESIIQYLTKNKLYMKSSIEVGKHIQGLVSRKYLADILGTHSSAFQHPSMRSFLRQFEPNFGDNKLLFSSRQNCANHVSHKTRFVEDAASHTLGVKAFRNHVQLLKHVLAGNAELPDYIPGRLQELSATQLLN
ncbi:hypothetical protein QN391_24535 [Pseudomonas sp. CCI1.2]|uniref:hypothetical protein n=1 Tax=Pseudomonas sp. CCI1.2 TaxID=3048614 RepID=UPI002B2270E7|nr:hypothetical protein [Pseudomonas sp. CCI1.2]MEB0123824.1 hypothetical protein [Pseudomonas sp. CCI1.2]